MRGGEVQGEAQGPEERKKRGTESGGGWEEWGEKVTVKASKVVPPTGIKEKFGLFGWWVGGGGTPQPHTQPPTP